MKTKLSRYCEGILEATWLAAVIITPLFFNIYSSRIFEPDKAVILRSIALVSLGAMLIKAIEEGGIHFGALKRNKSWIRTLWELPMIVPVIGLVAIYFISTIFSISPGISLWGSYQRLQGTYTTYSYLIIFMAIGTNMRNRSQVERLITATIITSFSVAFYGVLQHYGIDPIPWAGNTTTRIAANMGNSIFVASYLIMIVPLTVGRMVMTFRKLLNSEINHQIIIIQGTIYAFILILQILAIYFSQSRGPVMGLLGGGFFMALLLSLTSKKQWFRFVVVGAAITGAAFLICFNLENSPFEGLRQVPGLGRFSMLLDPESITARSRKYIWKGTANLVGIHPPLMFPDGETDSLNFIRPVIGYGPETMYVAFNQFYPPELGQVERRNASPDRSHNETWDALVFTGVAGLCIYILIFVTIFYYGIKWILLFDHEKEVYVVLGSMVIGGIGGSIGFSLWRGIEYFGLGLPFGIVIGLVVSIVIIGLIHKTSINSSSERISEINILIMLFSAVIAHFIEINFGIAIAATRLLFWIYTGLLIVTGFILPRHEMHFNTLKVSEEAIGVNDGSKQNMKIGQGKQRNRRREYQLIAVSTGEKREILALGLILSLIMVTISYDFILNPHQETSVFTILVNSFTRLSSEGNTYSAGILSMLGITLILGAALIATENRLIQANLNWWKRVAGTLVVAFVIWLLFSVIFAGKLSLMAMATPNNQYDVLAQVDEIGGLLSFYYIFLAGILGLLAFVIVDTMPSRMSASNSLGIVTSPVFLILLVLLINRSNIGIIKADIAYKTAEPFVSTGQWRMATYLYQRALQFAPMEDHYYLVLGRSYLEQAKTAEAVQEQDSLIQQAETDLKIAQALNPLNTDHTANLARLYNWWASRAVDQATMIDRGQVADRYFQTAVSLSPNNMNIWGEWAILYIKILHEPQIAYTLLSRAIEIDPNYSFTQGLMGDYYATLADSTDDNNGKINALEQAANYYTEAVRVHLSRDTTSKSTYLLSLVNVSLELAGRSDEDVSSTYIWSAIQELEAAMQTDLPEDDVWEIQEALAILYLENNDYYNAMVYAQLALESAPAAVNERIRSIIEAIKNNP